MNPKKKNVPKLTDFQRRNAEFRRRLVGVDIGSRLPPQEIAIIEQNLASNKAMLGRMFGVKGPQKFQQLKKFFRERPPGYKIREDDMVELMKITEIKPEFIEETFNDPRNVLTLRGLINSMEDMEAALRNRRKTRGA